MMQQAVLTSSVTCSQVTTHRLVSPSGMDGIYAVLSFMAGRPVFTHELPDIAEP